MGAGVRTSAVGMLMRDICGIRTVLEIRMENTILAINRSDQLVLSIYYTIQPGSQF